MGSITFSTDISIEHNKVLFTSYYQGPCPFCKSKIYTIRTSRIKESQDLGTPTKKRIADVEVKTLICNNCHQVFTPEHPLYPPNYTVSMDVIQTALGLAHRFLLSADAIAEALKIQNNVDISSETVQSWINDFSEPWFQAYFQTHPVEDAQKHFKVLTIDGTYLPAGKDTLGKKNNVQWSSVTQLKENLYLLTWWE